nr:MAG TPA: hypothetical protein [Caudoviricetes sp.]
MKVRFYHNLTKIYNKKKHFNYLLECFYIFFERFKVIQEEIQDGKISCLFN